MTQTADRPPRLPVLPEPAAALLRRVISLVPLERRP